jgi:hypothetical protein
LYCTAQINHLSNLRFQNAASFLKALFIIERNLEMPSKQEIEQLLDRKTAARYLRVSPGTLAVWDCTKRYDLRPLKVGRAVRYRRSDLDNFIERRLVR